VVLIKKKRSIGTTLTFYVTYGRCLTTELYNVVEMGK